MSYAEKEEWFGTLGISRYENLAAGCPECPCGDFAPGADVSSDGVMEWINEHYPHRSMNKSAELDSGRFISTKDRAEPHPPFGVWGQSHSSGNIGFCDMGAAAGSFTATFQMPKQYEYTPQKDITTYELALIVPILLCGTYDRSPDWETVKRHFTELK